MYQLPALGHTHTCINSKLSPPTGIGWKIPQNQIRLKNQIREKNQIIVKNQIRVKN